MNILASTVLECSDLGVAREILETALVVQHTLEDGDRAVLAGLSNTLGHVAFDQGSLDEAGRLYAESLIGWRQLGDEQGIAYLLDSLGNVAMLLERYDSAQASYAESLQIQWKRRDQGSVCVLLRDFACLAGVRGQHKRALRLEGAAQAIYKPLDDFKTQDPIQTLLDRAISAARDSLGPSQFEASLDRGRRTSIRDAVAFALAG